MQSDAGKTGSTPAAKDAGKTGSRLGSKSPDGKKAAASKSGAEETPMRKNDSKKNLVPRTKQKKADGARNRDSQEAEEKGRNQGGDEAKSPERTRKKKPGMSAGRGGGPLSQDFSSFDILWFDIETKMRDLIQDLCQPLVDKVHEGKDNLSQLRKQVNSQQAELQTLNQTVFEKGAKLDVFEEIHQRITNVEAERKRIESKLVSDADVILRTFENYTFEKEQVDRELKLAITKMHEQSDQLTEFVDVTRAQVGEIMERIRVESSQRTAADDELNQRLSTLRKDTQATQDQADATTVSLNSLSKVVGNGQERIAALELLTKQLADSKCENSEFLDNMKRLDDFMETLDTRVSETKNLCLKLDNYLFKYLPVRTQSVVGDTLRACLTGVERRRHELYDNDKIQLLYQLILEDDGGGSLIEKEIIHLNEQAKLVIDEEEKKKRRKTQASVTDESVNQGDGAGVKGQVSKGSISTVNAPRDASGKLRPDASRDDAKTLSNQGAHPSARGDLRGGPGAASSLMEDHEVYQLTDLINGDFHMPGSDKDYKLGHEQVIKVCKILLHKMNYNQLRNAQDYQLVLGQMKTDLQQSEQQMRSSMEEVNQFLQNVHSDFEKFLKRHGREHNDVNLKIQKLSDVAHKTLDNLDQMKEPVENYATFLTCLLEFSRIEQALAVGLTPFVDGGVAQPKLALGGANLARLQVAASASQEGTASARRAQGSTSYKSLARGGSSGSAGKAGKQRKPAGDHSFFPTYKTIDNNLTGLDEPLNLGGNKDGGKGGDRSRAAKEASRSRSKNLAGSVAVLSHQNANSVPANVNYRKNLLTRSQLVEMRQTLLDKCEEIISASEWPFGQFNLSTEKIFNDLLQFHAGEGDTLSNSIGFRQHASISQDGGSHRMPHTGKKQLHITTSPGAMDRKVSHVSRTKMGGHRDSSTIGGPKSSVQTGATMMSSHHQAYLRGNAQRSFNATQAMTFHNPKKSVAFNPSHYGGYHAVNSMLRGTPGTQGPIAPSLSQKSGSVGVYHQDGAFGSQNQQNATYHMGWLHSNQSGSIPTQTQGTAVQNNPDFALLAGSNSSIKYVNTNNPGAAGMQGPAAHQSGAHGPQQIASPVPGSGGGVNQVGSSAGHQIEGEANANLKLPNIS